MHANMEVWFSYIIDLLTESGVVAPEVLKKAIQYNNLPMLMMAYEKLGKLAI